jgi:hypothetical protein
MPRLTAERPVIESKTTARPPSWQFEIAFGLPFVVYLRTMLPGMAFGDWGEMQTVPHVLGVAHPTGYPTYVLLSWAAHLVPIGSVALRANMLSAVLVGAALAATVAILVRLGVRPLIALAAGLTLGAVGTVWAAATVAEVNPLHLFLIALLLHRALVWEERRQVADLVLGGLLVGLSLGNHLLTLFVVPGLAVFVVWVGRRELRARPWAILAAAAACVIGLSVYLYIPVAASQSPPLPYNHPVTVDGVWWLVSGHQFREQFDFLTPTGPADFVASLPALWALASSQATPAVPILGVVGLALLVKRRMAFGLMCAAILVIHLYVWSTYLRLEHYLLVAWLILAIGAAVALDAGARVLAARADGWAWRQRIPAVVGGIAVVFGAWLGVTNWERADRSQDRSAEVYVDAILEALPADAAILTQWDASTPLWHATLVLGRRPDVLVVDDTNVVYEGWGSRERRIEALICERPVYILRLNELDLLPTRELYRLEPAVTVDVALGGPSAAVPRTVYRVEPPGTCG